MLITGEVQCKQCGESVAWYYQIPNRMTDGIFDVDVIPKDKVGLLGKPYLLTDKCYLMRFWCPHCGHQSDFEYESSSVLR